MRSKKVIFITQAAMIAAIYVVLTLFVGAFNLASGAIQIRISEALTILPYFSPAAIPGLFAGCLFSNFFMGSPMPDIVFGSLATLLGALGSYALRNHKYLLTLSPVISNMLIIPFVLRYAYGLKVVIAGMDLSIPFHMATVGAGEVICCCILGTGLIKALEPFRQQLFPMTEAIPPDRSRA